MQLKKRLDSLERETAQGGDTGLRTIWVTSVAPRNEAGQCLRRLHCAEVMGKPGFPGQTVARDDNEPLRDFLERVAVIYEPIHGPVAGDWYERQDDAA